MHKHFIFAQDKFYDLTPPPSFNNLKSTANTNTNTKTNYKAQTLPIYFIPDSMHHFKKNLSQNKVFFHALGNSQHVVSCKASRYTYEALRYYFLMSALTGFVL